MPAPYLDAQKKIGFSFVIDCSLSEQGDCIAYEIQTTCSENFSNALNPEETKSKKLSQKKIWEDYLVNRYKDYFLVNFLEIANIFKQLQRMVIEGDEAIKRINPHYLFLKETDLLTIKSHFSSKKVVIKTAGSNGVGNLFLDLAKCSDQEILEKTRHLKNFIVEEQIMYAPLTHDRNRFLKYKELGVYYRFLVFYDPEKNKVEFYPVYRNILNLSESSDSHALGDTVNLEEIPYFLRKTPSDLEKITLSYREKYKNIDAIFSRIGRVFFQLTLQYQSKFTFSKKFIDLFHEGNPVAYYHFFQAEAKRYITLPMQAEKSDKNYFKCVEGKSLIENHAADSSRNTLYFALESLRGCFSGSKMEKDCPKNTAEQKKLFLSLLSILLAKNNFEFVELFVLKICILNSKTSHQTPLRDLWRQSSFFDSFISPKYGKTKAGSTALEMVDHAIDRSSTGTVVFLQEMIETNRVF